MKEIENIFSFFENIKSTNPRLDRDNKILIVECEISKDSFHSIMIAMRSTVDNKIDLKVEYNSFLLKDCPTFLDNIIIENINDLKNILKCCFPITLCQPLFEELNKNKAKK